MIATSTFINVYHKNEDYAIILKYKGWNHLPPHRLKLMYVKPILSLNLWRKLTSKILYEDGTLFNTKYVFNCSFHSSSISNNYLIPCCTPPYFKTQGSCSLSPRYDAWFFTQEINLFSWHMKVRAYSFVWPTLKYIIFINSIDFVLCTHKIMTLISVSWNLLAWIYF